MPKLPSDLDLGQLPSANSGRPQANIDLSGYAKGAAAIGEGVRQLGQGLSSAGGSAMHYLKSEKDKADELNTARATSKTAVDFVKLDDERDSEQDPEVLASYKPKYEAVVQQHAELITDEKAREKFLLRMAPDIEQRHVKATDQAWSINQKAAEAQTLDDLEQEKLVGASAKTPEEKKASVARGQKLIETLNDNGFIDDKQAQKMRRDWANGFSVSAIQAKAPGQRLALLAGGTEGSIIGSESDGNPLAVNQLNYIGLHQFGAPRLADLGVYKPGKDEKVTGPSSNWTSAKDKQWTGEFNIPGFPTVKTKDDFLRNTAAQRAVYGLHEGDIEKQITAQGLDKYIGQTVGGVEITKSGIIAMAHLGGTGGAAQFLQSGGKYNPPDANGKRLSDYAGQHGKPGSNPDATFVQMLTPEQKVQLQDGAVREIVQADRAFQTQQRHEVAAVQSLMKAEERSIMNTGAPVKELTTDRVSAALGPEAAASYEQNRTAAQRYYEQTHDWDQIPLDDIQRRVGELAPQKGSPDYANQERNYVTAQAHAQEVRKQRLLDPAGAVNEFPYIKLLRDQGGAIDKPEAFAPVVAGRMQAQKAIGISDDQAVPLTRDEAMQLWKPIELAKGDERETRDALKATVEQLDVAMGGDKELVQAALGQILIAGKASKDTAVLSSVVLRKLTQGEKPTAEEARKVDTAAANDASAKAYYGIDPSTVYDTSYAGTGGGAAKPAPKYPTPGSASIQALRANPTPEGMAKFDAAFGPGASETIFKSAPLKPAKPVKAATPAPAPAPAPAPDKVSALEEPAQDGPKRYDFERDPVTTRIIAMIEHPPETKKKPLSGGGPKLG